MDARAESLAIKRLRILARLSFFWGALIVGRLCWLQTVEHDSLKHQAEAQQDKEIEIQAPRGEILDRTGQPLAMSLPADSVCVNPLRVPDITVASRILAKELNLNEGEIFGKMANCLENRRGFLWIKRKITPDESAKLRSLNLDWIEFRTESRRFYPKGELAAHLLGGVDFQEHGNGGIEQGLDQDLAGKAGIVRTTSDVRQHVIEEEVYTEPQAGKNITLTIDERIQHVAEKAIADAVQEHHAQTGSVVVMVPQTGEILAMAAYPSYDPNEPVKPGDPVENRRNLPIMAPFEPGSVFKVVTLSAALETTNIRPDTIVPCGSGKMVLFKRVIHDHNAYAALSMRDVLAKSSNIGAINIGLKVGDRMMYEYVRRFGFGKPTGLPLPGESGGLVRKLEHWQPSSIGSVAMGHEVMATTVQLAEAASVIANGGVLMKPRLVIRKQRPVPGQDPDEPMAQPVRVLRPETAVTMGQMMKHVVEPGGTGFPKAVLKGYSSAGKTGTAQVYDFKARMYTHKYNASFMGFAPVANPAVVVVATVNGASEYGATVAAPVFNKVATTALRILDVPKDLPDDIVVPDHVDQPADDDDVSLAELNAPDSDQQTVLASTAAAPAADRPGAPGPALSVLPANPGATVPPAVVQQAVALGPKVPNFRGMTMRAVMEESAAKGLNVELVGSGIVRAQIPEPGSLLRPGEAIRVQFAR